MNISHWTYRAGVAVTSALLLLAAGVAGQQPAPKDRVAPRTGLIRGDRPADLLKAARLELKSGRTDVALQLCARIKREFPEDEEVTPRALIMGAEIYLRRKRPDQARYWTGAALERFRGLEDYQRRMAILHRRALTMVTRREEKHPAFRWAWCFLRAGYKARGLSCHDIRVRWFRFWREVKAHRRHWDRPGVEAEEGGPGIPPTGMRRHVEVIAARLARGACAAAGKRVEVLDEVVELLPRRLALLRRLWVDPAVTAEEHRRFEGLMREIGRRVRRLKRWVYRGRIWGR